MAIQLISAVVEMALRLQCIDSSSGLRNTPSEKIDPLSEGDDRGRGGEHHPAVEESALTHGRELR